MVPFLVSLLVLGLVVHFFGSKILDFIESVFEDNTPPPSATAPVTPSVIVPAIAIVPVNSTPAV
jgi:hypothetical protein